LSKYYKPLHLGNFNNVNEPFECVMLLDKLNLAIDTFYKLSDARYYTDYIFNQSTIVLDALKDNGLTEEFFTETAYKMERLRSLLFGEHIDWQGLVEYEMRSIATSEYNEKRQLEDRVKKLEYEIKKSQQPTLTNQKENEHE